MKPPLKMPLMVEAQFYSSDTSEFRLSMRSASDINSVGESHLMANLVSLYRFFMYP